MQDVLVTDYELALTGWTLMSAKAISADGLTIVGYGTHPSSYTEARIATIPEPSTALLVATGLLNLAHSRKRRS